MAQNKVGERGFSLCENGCDMLTVNGFEGSISAFCPALDRRACLGPQWPNQ